MVKITISKESEKRITAKNRCICLRTSYSLYVTFVLLTYIMILFHSASSQEVKYFCNPTNNITCMYGGECKLIRTLPQILKMNFEPELEYMCVCDSTPCADPVAYDPVCAEDGNTYPNDQCRRYHECIIQKTVKSVCRGRCKSRTCKYRQVVKVIE
ncbi:unnamed protein product [Clavelina lepadiformis]|uniref:Kazal-like domain-containing protein n=1 Tax=Clavelina lepadiformis TaxID=159417 RepID=A0ABP0GFI0_CLALP